jgi:diguanylate cyclase (GGDEF)-like protein/putative nucleotidyltransferase with HDIG domain
MNGSTTAKRDQKTAGAIPWGPWMFLFVCLAAYGLGQLAPLPDITRAAFACLLLVVTLAWAVESSVEAMLVTSGKNRRLWRTLAISLSAFLAAFAYRLYWLVVHKGLPAVGSFEDFMFIFGFLAMVPVVLLMAESYEASRLRKVRSVVDFLSILTAALTLVYVGLALPLGLFDPAGDWRSNVLFLVFPVMAVSYVAFLATFKKGRWYTDEVMLFIAMLLSAAATVLSVYALAIRHYAPNDVANASASGLFLLSFAFFAMGARYRKRKSRPAKRDMAPVSEGMQWPGVTMQALAIAAIPLLVFYAGEIRNTVSREVLISATALLAALVVARGVLAQIENQRLSSQSLSDPLTGLFNDRYFRDRLRVEVDHALADGQSMALCLVDFDHFDDFSREHGFAAADRRVKWFSGVLLDWGIDPDLVFRTGEDDFARIMPMATAEQALEECRRLAGASIEPPDRLGSLLTFSAGIAVVPQHTTDAGELVRLAQGALYWAKNRGPGSLVVFDPAEVEALDSREHILRLREQTHTRLVESFAAAVDARDPYTKYHSLNVAALAEKIAREMGLDEERCALIEAAALLHDVGKIGVPDAILRKPGRLDPAEYDIVKQHPDLAVQILAASARPEMLLWIHQHHERPDGNGYPQGLTAEEITLEARILAVCDAYDAITTERPYRAGVSPVDACEELQRYAGTQFDAEIVGRLCSVVLADAHVAPASMKPSEDMAER